MYLSENKIKKIADDFRNAIDATNFPAGTEAHSRMRDFPYEGCIVACGILGTYLVEKYGCIQIEEFCGPIQELDGSQGTHHWLEYNGIIIDITCDQFNHLTMNTSVATNSEFHNMHVKGKEKLDNVFSVSNFLSWEREIYDLVLQTLEESAKNGTGSEYL